MGHEGHDHGEHHPHHPSHGGGEAHAHRAAPQEAASTPDEHRAHAPAQVASFVITCSDSRDPQSDGTGQLIRRLLEGQGHPVVGHQVIRDEAASIRAALTAAAEAGARAVIFNGGTGISSRDVTVDTLEALFEKRLPGFGELFRMLSFQQVGSAAWLSRATAGIWQGLVVFALPGSPRAAELGLEKLILPELGHVVRELSR